MTNKLREIGMGLITEAVKGYTDETTPLYTIEDAEGKPYLSIIDEDTQIRLQLHKYDVELFRPVYITIDKRALPALVATLASVEL